MIERTTDTPTKAQSSRTLCHFCAKRREVVASFNLPERIKLKSGRTKIRLCIYCIETLDQIASDSEAHPSRKP